MFVNHINFHYIILWEKFQLPKYFSHEALSFAILINYVIDDRKKVIFSPKKVKNKKTPIFYFFDTKITYLMHFKI